MRIHERKHACSGPQNYVEQMAGVPTDGFDGIFLSHSRTDSSWLAVYQNHFDRITSTVSQGSDPRSPRPLPVFRRRRIDGAPIRTGARRAQRHADRHAQGAARL